jgi:hypothetical protein
MFGRKMKFILLLLMNALVILPALYAEYNDNCLYDNSEAGCAQRVFIPFLLVILYNANSILAVSHISLSLVQYSSSRDLLLKNIAIITVILSMISYFLLFAFTLNNYLKYPDNLDEILLLSLKNAAVLIPNVIVPLIYLKVISNGMSLNLSHRLFSLNIMQLISVSCIIVFVFFSVMASCIQFYLIGSDYSSLLHMITNQLLSNMQVPIASMVIGFLVADIYLQEKVMYSKKAKYLIRILFASIILGFLAQDYFREMWSIRIFLFLAFFVMYNVMRNLSAKKSKSVFEDKRLIIESLNEELINGQITQAEYDNAYRNLMETSSAKDIQN